MKSWNILDENFNDTSEAQTPDISETVVLSGDDDDDNSPANVFVFLKVFPTEMKGEKKEAKKQKEKKKKEYSMIMSVEWRIP